MATRWWAAARLRMSISSISRCPMWPRRTMCSRRSGPTSTQPLRGAIRVAILSALPDRWLVIEWDAVKEYSSAATDHCPDLDPSRCGGGCHLHLWRTRRHWRWWLLDHRCRKLRGSSGQNYYLNGTGGPLGGDVQVTAAPGVPGETRVVSFKATGAKAGRFTNYAKLRSDLFQGINVASFSGTVTP